MVLSVCESVHSVDCWLCSILFKCVVIVHGVDKKCWHLVLTRCWQCWHATLSVDSVFAVLGWCWQWQCWDCVDIAGTQAALMGWLKFFVAFNFKLFLMSFSFSAWTTVSLLLVTFNFVTLHYVGLCYPLTTCWLALYNIVK